MTPCPDWLTLKKEAVYLTVACHLFSQNTISDQKLGWIVIPPYISCLETVSSALSGGWFGMWARYACMANSKSWFFFSALDCTENLLTGLNFVIGIDKTSLQSLLICCTNTYRLLPWGKHRSMFLRCHRDSLLVLRWLLPGKDSPVWQWHSEDVAARPSTVPL